MWIKITFGAPEKLISFMSLGWSMRKDLQRVLEKAGSEERRRDIQEIIDLDISILTKHLFIFESLKWATEIIGKLHEQQRATMLEEMRKIDITKHWWRIWMADHMRELCTARN
ncbi:MAG: hypothetical protein ACD_3C00225G0003 [uncultured bacterium (gcode 4)]|uniref:Uncharacterized protein n=1 Tax=uncultured bacterium (gcode 4) TaxID=1234023 RepID=K2GVF1_9BACT|nr:MAG: hypothetical protein ACD_3C00225G0003 [uncultured bacterium (gcode 4)]